jgi:hypothetical protein
MIFQIGLDLNTADPGVQAVIDLDTGIIGFTQDSDDEQKEWLFNNAPVAYRIALFEQLSEYAAERCHLNMQISRKSDFGALVQNYVLSQE